ncbi:MAG: hypothetical protein LUE27_00695 [Clostridia bacterium]|nr:hypothetical protein [Clostridia bacterium]
MDAKENLREIFEAHNVDKDFMEEDSLEIMLGILHDTTFFDELDAGGMEDRLDAFKRDRNNEVLAHSMFSCMVIVPFYCLVREEKGEDVCYTGKSNYDKSLNLYTSPEACKDAALKQKYDLVETDIVEAVNYCTEHKVTGITVNPDTQNVKFIAKKVVDVIEAMNDYEMVLDDIMAEGIPGANLDATWFERFLGREVECTLTDGRNFKGVIHAAEGEDARQDEAVYTPDDPSEEPVSFLMGDISSIRDITNEDPITEEELENLVDWKDEAEDVSEPEDKE